MARETFVPYAPAFKTRSLVRFANEIVDRYRRAGYVLTVRQIYYQFVKANRIPNNLNSYKQLADVLNKARLGGLIDWDMIEDRTRNLERMPMWDTPEDILSGAARQYREDPWRNQKFYFEAWIEKEALIGVLERVANEFRIPYFACRGFTSQSEMYEAGKRLERMAKAGKKIVVLHLGDHDPSGWDMSRDNLQRLSMFSRSRFEFKRLCLNLNQINELGLPPNPAKTTDSRYKRYVDEFSVDDSWEMDALEPQYIHDLVAAAIWPHIDWDQWEKDLVPEKSNRFRLKTASERWEEVTSALQFGPWENGDRNVPNAT